MVFEVIEEFEHVKGIGNKVLVSTSGRFVNGIKFLLQHAAESLFEHKETGKRSRKCIKCSAIIGTLLADFIQIRSGYTPLLG